MQPRPPAVVLLALLVLLAGCSLPGLDGTPTSEPWTGDEDNPWREATLTVAVHNEANASRDYRPMVREALAYWEANADRYAGYPIAYELRPAGAEGDGAGGSDGTGTGEQDADGAGADGADADEPDLEIRFVESIDECGTEGRTAGCAPIVRNGSAVSRPATVEIQGNFTHESTVRVLKHELGHTLGLDHGDEPADVMQHRSELAVLPQRDATDRVMPWRSPELSVYVDESTVPTGEREETRRQVAAALGYVADGADGTVPENVSFVRTENRSAANVVIEFADASDCTAGAGSCGSLEGYDPDRDGALETYSRLQITVVDVEPEARGWHVGYWTARGFGLSEDELPEPLRTDDADVRRSEWWE